MASPAKVRCLMEVPPPNHHLSWPLARPLLTPPSLCRIFFVTNNSTKSRKGYKGKFTELGLNVQDEEIFSSSFAAAAYLEQKNFKATGKPTGNGWLLLFFSSFLS